MNFFKSSPRLVNTALASAALMAAMLPARAELLLDLQTAPTPITGPCGSGCGTIAGSTWGWSFTLTGTKNVTAIGAWDVDADGIGGATPVGLWNSSGVLLASATVTNSSTVVASASADGQWLFENIPQLTLGSGNYYLGMLGFDTTPDAQYYAPYSVTSGVSNVVGAGSVADSGFGAPTVPFNDFQIIGPNLAVAAVPEPASVALFGLGGALVLASARRRKSAAKRAV